ncbi:hypothetical protein HCH54_005262 [Aspergillus fumigatus]
MAGSILASEDGISGGYVGHDLGLNLSIVIPLSITLYNATELMVLIFATFKRYGGLYFWSLLISSLFGLVLYSLGFLLKLLQLTSARWLSVTILTVGWYCMVTGQSVVLYSRLHLVVYDQRILTFVLYLIIMDAFLLHIPTTVLTYGSNLGGNDLLFIKGFVIMEKIQMTGFCLQEFTISGLYIWHVAKMLRLNLGSYKKKLLLELFMINFLIILMDIGLLVTEYLNYYLIEATAKGAIYSVKLKLEFAVLGKMVALVQSHSGWVGVTSDWQDSAQLGARELGRSAYNRIAAPLGNCIPGLGD